MDKGHPILTKEIKFLATSDEFLEMSQANGFKNLKDIIDQPTSELLKKPFFNYRMLTELGIMLQGYGLLRLLRED